MESVDIYKRLKQHYNMIQSLNQDVLFVALDKIDGDQISSIVVTLPSIDNILFSVSSDVYRVSTILGDPICVVDIRDLIKFCSDTNSKFFNMLFTEYTIANKKYREYTSCILNGSNNIVGAKYMDTLQNIIKQILLVRFADIYRYEKDVFDVHSYNNVFVTADNHFGHNNIMEYENRKEKLNVETIDEHDAMMIAKWNSVVGKNDLVYILGDFSFHKPARTMEILKSLNGDKILIEGNHDIIYLKNKLFDKTLFLSIEDYTEINYKGQPICMMHYPIQDFKYKDRPKTPFVHLHGHIHSIPKCVPRNSYNVVVDLNDYKPVSIKEAIQKALSNDTGGHINGTSLIRG